MFEGWIGSLAEANSNGKKNVNEPLLIIRKNEKKIEGRCDACNTAPAARGRRPTYGRCLNGRREATEVRTVRVNPAPEHIFGNVSGFVWCTLATCVCYKEKKT